MKYKHPTSLKPVSFKRHSGSALIMAVFILVIMALLGVSLSRMLSSSSDAIAWEVLGSRALMAANSGGERALFELFPPGQAVTSCASISTSITTFPASSGLSHCQTTINCNDFAQPALGTHHYQITATGQCQAGTINALRTVELEARTAIP